MKMKFNNISKSYCNNNRNINILNNINVEFEKGKITLIMGSSGIGKTTLLNITGCLLKPDTGFLKQDNISYNLTKDNMDNFRIKNFGYVFQNFNLLPEFNIYENLLMPCYINHLNIVESKRRINELLNYMKLEYLKFSYPNYISHGEKQRVAFIRSLIGRQNYIFADEPTGNLDEINTKIILDLIVNINQDFNCSFIIASHDKEFINIANNIYLIKNGKIINKQ